MWFYVNVIYSTVKQKYQSNAHLTLDYASSFYPKRYLAWGSDF